MSWSSYHRKSRWGSLARLLKKIWSFGWKATLTLLVPLLLIIAAYAYQANHFDLSEVQRIPTRTILIDREGQEYGTIHGEKRRLITYEEIPDFLKLSLFAREDARFLHHEGVDLRGLARATLRNFKDRDFTQGASTLSMQLARNTYDLREKKSLHRKFLEIALTYRIESRFSKKEILSSYLNRIYFGSGCHGIEEAAQSYFGTQTSQLNRAQCALLVGIIRAPHTYSPWRNLKGAMRQRDEVLARLIHTQIITKEEALTIKNTPLQLRNPKAPQPGTNHASRALRRPLEVVLKNSQITTGGLRVITSIDFSIQKALEQMVHELPLAAGCQIATLALDPRNGDILGIVGCREKEPSGFNRALDSHRDLGPAMIAPLIGTMALERGHLPVEGNPVATGRQLQEKDAIQLLSRFGFEGKFSPGDDLYRGSLTVSVLELATAYATILQHGSRPAPVFVRELLNGKQTLFRRPPAFYPAFSEHARLEKIPTHLTGLSLPKTDLWAAVLSEEQIIVTWIGYDRPKKLPQNEALLKTLLPQLQGILNKTRELPQ